MGPGSIRRQEPAPRAAMAEKVTASLERVLARALELEHALADVRDGAQPALIEKLVALTGDLEELDGVKNEWPIAVPREAIRHADEGKDLEVFKRELVTSVARAADDSRGRQHAFAHMFSELYKHAKARYPEEASEYAQAVTEAGGSVPSDEELRAGIPPVAAAPSAPADAP